MAAWRYKISLLMLKKIFHSYIFSTLEGKFRIPTQPCNILYIYIILLTFFPKYFLLSVANPRTVIRQDPTLERYSTLSATKPTVKKIFDAGWNGTARIAIPVVRILKKKKIISLVKHNRSRYHVNQKAIINAHANLMNCKCNAADVHVLSSTENWCLHDGTRHSKTKTEARSTQISKTKHPKLENEAPKTTQISKTKHPKLETTIGWRTTTLSLAWRKQPRQQIRPHFQRSTNPSQGYSLSLRTV